MGYQLKYTRQADKDACLLEQAGLDKIAKKLLSVMKQNPYQYPPAYEKLQGDLKGLYSRRINRGCGHTANSLSKAPKVFLGHWA
jgi:Txe/YoeB family toxin of toxin-antitoxin system